MSDHPDVPRLEFDENGFSMNIEEAVEQFRALLLEKAKLVPKGDVKFTLSILMRECDCDSTLEGRDDGCPLHGLPDAPSDAERYKAARKFLLTVSPRDLDDPTLLERISKWLDDGGDIPSLVQVTRAEE